MSQKINLLTLVGIPERSKDLIEFNIKGSLNKHQLGRGQN